MKRALLTLSLALWGSGCLQGVPDNINCLSDDTCPTGYFCSDNNNCLSLEDGSPPTLKFNGVGTDPGAANGTVLNLPVGTFTFYLSASNTGTHDANGVGIALEGPPCAQLQNPDAAVNIAAGSGVVKSASSNASLPCADADVTVTLDLPQGASLEPYHRVTTATFRVHVGP